MLDLGSEDRSHIRNVLGDANYRASNVYIADINPGALERGSAAHGLVPVLIDESKPMGFGDGFFDIIFRSSAIEHVTVPKAEAWTVSGGKASGAGRLLAKQILPTRFAGLEVSITCRHPTGISPLRVTAGFHS
jgi:hypothetical protein